MPPFKRGSYAPPSRRSERIRARTEAADRAADQAAEAASQAPSISIVEEPSPRGSAGEPAAVGSSIPTNAPGTSGVLDSTLLAGGSGSTTLEDVLPLSIASAVNLYRGENGPRNVVGTMAADRIKRELIQFQKEPPEGCYVELDEDNLFRWKATIKGPAGTPYEGGVFHLLLLFHHNYPFMPPRVVFMNKLYHCNVSSTGIICMDILSSEWSPVLTVAKVLVSIISLLGDPNPDDALQPVLADLYKRKRDVYDKNARLWTQKYAKPEEDEQTQE